MAFSIPFPDVLALPPLDRAAATTGSRNQVGARRLIDPQAMESARWIPLPDGRPVWSLRLRSPDAVGLRVHFDRFNIGNGKLWVIESDLGKTRFFGPYTGTGPLQSGEFWTEILFSETVEIEYIPEDGSREDLPPFHVVSLSHLWDLHALSRRAASPATTSANVSCFLDATCFPSDSIGASPSLTINIDLPDGSNADCSATLIRTVAGSRIPYMLTAGHCIPDASSATSVVAVWNNQTSVCNGVAPNLSNLPQQSGSTFLSAAANPSDLDYSFVRLSGLPAGSFPSFSGWDPGIVATAQQVVSLSHPYGLALKFALGVLNPSGNRPDSYSVVFSSQGRTDEGSSGSGLFETGVPGDLPLIGVDSTGTGGANGTICDINPGGSVDSYFTMFASIYPYISSYLNDSVTPPPSSTVNFTASPNPIPAPGQTTTLTWNAPGYSSLVIRVNSATGIAMTGTVGSSGSATTGTWVTDGMQFFLVDLSSGASLASVTVNVGAAPPPTSLSFTASPNPIPAAGQTTTLTWNAPGHSSLVIRVGSATGTAMTGTVGSSGSATTGTWVTDGMQFFLVDVSSGATVASVIVHVTGSGGGGVTPGVVTLAANPNPVAAAGQTTTLNWNAPGHAHVVIVVGTPTGPPMTGIVGPTGSATTGTWLTDGMQFFLMDADSYALLASVEVHVGSGVIQYTNLSPTGAFSSSPWCVSGPTATGCGPLVVRQIAVPFTCGSSFVLHGISLPLGYSSGSSSDVTVTLLADSGGLPGSIVETWNVPVLPDSNPPPLTTLLDPFATNLLAGRKYWIEVQAYGDTLAVWYQNFVGFGGGFENNGSGWAPLGGATSLPGFTITGLQ
jgi:hypothetical protein